MKKAPDAKLDVDEVEKVSLIFSAGLSNGFWEAKPSECGSLLPLWSLEFPVHSSQFLFAG
jgi:hypothetical protein